LAAAYSAAASVIVAVWVAVAPVAQASSQRSFVGEFNTVTNISSTAPRNGDVNPYGVAVVKDDIGKLRQVNVLVSNFNNSQNQQGSGWVVVGSLPTADGTSATAQAGCLLVLNSRGRVVETFSGHGINGPWDMTTVNFRGVAELFVTNVLNGTVAADGAVVNRGTVLRLLVTTPDHGLPKLLAVTKIGSGFPERTDPAALVIGPTGVGLGVNGTLYVAGTLDNRIAAIPGVVFRRTTAGTGRTVSENGTLNAPLGLAIAPGGHVLTVNGGDGNLVETTPAGKQVAVKLLDATTPPPAGGAGALFGLAVAPHGEGVYFVDDDTNTLNLLH
jgi:hypothetical protein